MKLLFSDYDNTLCVDTNVSYLNLEAIRNFRRNNNKFIITTGRSYDSIMKEIKKYDIEYDYLSCTDGLQLFNKNDVLLKKRFLKTEAIILLQKDIEDKYQIKGKTTISVNDKHPQVLQYHYDVATLDNRVELLEDINRKLQYIDDVDSFMIDFSKTCKMIVIRPKGISKAITVGDVVTLEAVDKNDVFAIGDHVNDLEMLESADVNGFCRGEIREELQGKVLGSYESVSDLITDIKYEKVLTKKR